jgi:hypothetical protein
VITTRRPLIILVDFVVFFAIGREFPLLNLKNELIKIELSKTKPK